MVSAVIQIANRVKALKAMDTLARFANNEYRYEEWAIIERRIICYTS